MLETISCIATIYATLVYICCVSAKNPPKNATKVVVMLRFTIFLIFNKKHNICYFFLMFDAWKNLFMLNRFGSIWSRCGLPCIWDASVAFGAGGITVTAGAPCEGAGSLIAIRWGWSWIFWAACSIVSTSPSFL